MGTTLTITMKVAVKRVISSDPYCGILHTAHFTDDKS